MSNISFKNKPSIDFGVRKQVGKNSDSGYDQTKVDAILAGTDTNYSIIPLIKGGLDPTTPNDIEKIVLYEIRSNQGLPEQDSETLPVNYQNSVWEYQNGELVETVVGTKEWGVTKALVTRSTTAISDIAYLNSRLTQTTNLANANEEAISSNLTSIVAAVGEIDDTIVKQGYDNVSENTWGEVSPRTYGNLLTSNYASRVDNSNNHSSLVTQVGWNNVGDEARYGENNFGSAYNNAGTWLGPVLDQSLIEPLRPDGTSVSDALIGLSETVPLHTIEINNLGGKIETLYPTNKAGYYVMPEYYTMEFETNPEDSVGLNFDGTSIGLRVPSQIEIDYYTFSTDYKALFMMTAENTSGVSVDFTFAGKNVVLVSGDSFRCKIYKEAKEDLFGEVNKWWMYTQINSDAIDKVEVIPTILSDFAKYDFAWNTIQRTTFETMWYPVYTVMHKVQFRDLIYFFRNEKAHLPLYGLTSDLDGFTKLRILAQPCFQSSNITAEWTNNNKTANLTILGNSEFLDDLCIIMHFEWDNPGFVDNSLNVVANQPANAGYAIKWINSLGVVEEVVFQNQPNGWSHRSIVLLPSRPGGTGNAWATLFSWVDRRVLDQQYINEPNLVGATNRIVTHMTIEQRNSLGGNSHISSLTFAHRRSLWSIIQEEYRLYNYDGLINGIPEVTDTKFEACVNIQKFRSGISINPDDGVVLSDRFQNLVDALAEFTNLPNNNY